MTLRSGCIRTSAPFTARSFYKSADHAADFTHKGIAVILAVFYFQQFFPPSLPSWMGTESVPAPPSPVHFPCP